MVCPTQKTGPEEPCARTYFTAQCTLRSESHQRQTSSLFHNVNGCVKIFDQFNQYTQQRAGQMPCYKLQNAIT